MASTLVKSYIGDQQGDSAYLNIPFYQQRIDPSDPSWMIDQGPPSMYNDVQKSDRIKNKEDMRRQGPHPGPVDSLINHSTVPVTNTNYGNPKEDAQGEVPDNVKVRSRPGDEDSGEDNNRETIHFDPGTINVDPFKV